MIRSIRICTAITALALSTAPAAAQMPAPGMTVPPHFVPPGMQVPAQAASYAPPGMAMAPPMTGGYPAPMTGGMMAPPMNPGVPPGVSYGGNVVNYRVNRHGSTWNDSQPIEAFLTQLGQRSWLRLEYLNWDVEDPGKRTIGARISDTDGRTPFAVQDRVTGEDFGFAVVPTFDNVSLNDNAGVRGTYGIWFNGGSIEFSVFGTEQASDEILLRDLQANRPEPADPLDPNPPPPNAGLGTQNNPNVVIPLKLNGAVSDSDALTFLVFDSSYRASLRSQMWGAEFNVFTSPYGTSDGITWQWLGGIRYLNFDESFGQTGVSDGGGAFAPVTTRIRSSVTNNMYGPTAGFRAQYSNKYVTLSATPRITFALNDYTARMAAQGPAFTNPVRDHVEEIDFTTITQVSLLAEVNVSDSMTVFGGYDFLWSYRTARPFRSVDYDSTLGTTQVEPQLSLKPDPDLLSIEGLNAGILFRF